MAWFQRSASRGLALASSNIGKLYENGQGIEKNLETAVRYYSYAASLGEQTSTQALLRLNRPIPESRENSVPVANKAQSAPQREESGGNLEIITGVLDVIGDHYKNKA